MRKRTTYTTTYTLNERAEAVLKCLVSLYIDSATPIGSTTLARDSELSLSPATIRNVMADLENQGLIHSPHTSSGRIPTQEGYRMFINSMLMIHPLDQRAIGEIQERFSDNRDPKKLCEGASEVLSQITSYAGIISMPAIQYSQLKQVEFLKLSDHRVLAIMVTGDGRVHNKVLHTETIYSNSELVQSGNYFNQEYHDKSLSSVRNELIKHMQQDSEKMDKVMRAAVEMVGELLPDNEQEGDVLLTGENNLLAIPDLAELDKFHTLLDTFKMKQVLLDLLQKSATAVGVNIFIGEESGYSGLKDCSLIMSPYKVDNQRVGVLGVIGPTRMHYDDVISVVGVTAKLLGNALSSHKGTTE